MASRRPAPSGGKTASVSMSLDMTDFQQFRTRCESAVQAATWQAASAAADVVYRRMKKRVDGIPKLTGNLARSIYFVYSKDRSNEWRRVYHASWNHIKAPHGRLVEWGFVQRYQPIFNKKLGRWHMLRQGEFVGKPSTKGSRGKKAAGVYVLRKTPVRTKAWRFVGRARDDFPEAALAARRAFNETAARWRNLAAAGRPNLSGGAAP